MFETRWNWLLSSAGLAVLLAAGLYTAATTACSSCHERVVQSAIVGDDEIAVIQRVCGSVSGYELSVAPPGKNTNGVADRYEPFMVGCDCYDLSNRIPPPVKFTLQPGNVILVQYDGSKMWSVDKQRPTQGKFRLIYESTLQQPAP